MSNEDWLAISKQRVNSHRFCRRLLVMNWNKLAS